MATVTPSAVAKLWRKDVPREARYAGLRDLLEEDGSDPAQYNPNGLHQGLPERYAADGDSPLPIGPDTTRVTSASGSTAPSRSRCEWRGPLSHRGW